LGPELYATTITCDGAIGACGSVGFHRKVPDGHMNSPRLPIVSWFTASRILPPLQDESTTTRAGDDTEPPSSLSVQIMYGKIELSFRLNFAPALTVTVEYRPGGSGVGCDPGCAVKAGALPAQACWIRPVNAENAFATPSVSSTCASRLQKLSQKQN